MRLSNSHTHFGLISILLHWIMAILLVGLYLLGDYMVDLDYYDDWYHSAPGWHKSTGMIVVGLLLLRLGWKLTQLRPMPLVSYKVWEVKLAGLVHHSFYLLMFIMTISGYFISTAKNAAIDVFGWFSIPAITELSKTQAELAATIHEASTTVFIVLVVLHIMAALKHQFIDKDKTLIRMLKPDDSIKSTGESK